MKRVMIIIATAVFCAACCNRGDEGIVINEQDHENTAYDKSYELAERVINAVSYEEYRAVAKELRAYEEAFRTQIGGDSYLIFLEESNAILSNI